MTAPSRQIPDASLYAISTLIWGSTWFAITLQFGTVAPGISVGWRFLLAGCLLLAYCKWRGDSLRLPQREYPWVIAQGVLLFGVSYICVYRAEQLMASGLMAVLNSAMLPFNMLGMRLAFGVRAGSRGLIGAALGLLGIVLVFWPEIASMREHAGWLGIAFGTCAAFLASCGNLVAQRNRNAGQAMLPGTALAMLAGGLSALLIGVLGGDALVFDMRPAYIASLLYLAVFGSVISFLSYFTLIGRIGAGRAGYVAVAVPILALVLSGLLEGFVWRVETVVGIACALAGNIIMLKRPA